MKGKLSLITKSISLTSRMLSTSAASSTTTSSLTLYGFPFSQPTRSIMLLLKENEVPYNFVLVDALKGHNRKPEFLKFHPAGLVPCIKDDNFILGESCAIMCYLADSRKLNSYYPLDLKVRANVNFWMHWHHANTRKSTKEVLVPVLFPPKNKSIEDVKMAGLNAYTRSITFLENHLKQQGSNKFIAGTESPTIADLIIITELDQLKIGVWNLFDYSKYPAVDQYMNLVAKSLRYYGDILQPVIEVAKKR